MELFRYAPAPLRRAKEYQIDSKTLVDLAGNRRLDLSMITHARFISGGYGKFQMDRLELKMATQKIQIPITVRAGGTDCADYQTWHALVLKTLDGLHGQCPALKIAISETKPVKWAMFLIGLFTLFGSLGLLGFAFASHIPLEKLIKGGVVFFGLACFGFVLARAYNPFLTETYLNPEQLKTVLAA